MRKRQRRVRIPSSIRRDDRSLVHRPSNTSNRHRRRMRHVLDHQNAAPVEAWFHTLRRRSNDQGRYHGLVMCQDRGGAGILLQVVGLLEAERLCVSLDNSRNHRRPRGLWRLPQDRLSERHRMRVWGPSRLDGPMSHEHPRRRHGRIQPQEIFTKLLGNSTSTEPRRNRILRRTHQRQAFLITVVSKPNNPSESHNRRRPCSQRRAGARFTAS